ncbi:transposase [Clostridium sp. AN503]|uniref:transposase n=1 Tax=Clostridium sp. AN503 TaxID=3160598 RepID=UPI0034573F3C
MAKGKYEYWLTPDGLLKLESWARDGLTDEQLAERMNITPSTLYEWKKRYSEISESLKKGKEVVDIQVENALLKRALGYAYNEDKYISVPMELAEYDEKLTQYMKLYRFEHPEATDSELMLIKEQFPKTKMILAERKTKEVVPDTTAQIFWLKNRRPDKWRDKQDMELSGEVKSTNPYAGLTTEELKKLIHGG